MARLMKLILFIVLTGLTIWYLSARISSYDLRFYSGKDNGYFVRLASICILSSIFWALMTDYSRIKHGILGFVIGIASALIAYFSLISLEDNAMNQVIFHILACLVFMTTFFLFHKSRTIKNNNS
jgi:hypothetical protein